AAPEVHDELALHGRREAGPELAPLREVGLERVPHRREAARAFPLDLLHRCLRCGLAAEYRAGNRSGPRTSSGARRGGRLRGRDRKARRSGRTSGGTALVRDVSRLQPLDRAYHSPILLSNAPASTRRAPPPPRHLGRTAPRGRSEARAEPARAPPEPPPLPAPLPLPRDPRGPRGAPLAAQRLRGRGRRGELPPRLRAQGLPPRPLLDPGRPPPCDRGGRRAGGAGAGDEVTGRPLRARGEPGARAGGGGGAGTLPPPPAA